VGRYVRLPTDTPRGKSAAVAIQVMDCGSNVHCCVRPALFESISLTPMRTESIDTEAVLKVVRPHWIAKGAAREDGGATFGIKLDSNVTSGGLKLPSAWDTRTRKSAVVVNSLSLLLLVLSLRGW
jgi:hypothetical protein